MLMDEVYAKSFRRPFPKGRRFQRQSLWSRPAGREILFFHKDQEGRRNSPVGCCVAGNPIKGFPDAAYHAAFVHLAICQPVFRHAGTPGAAAPGVPHTGGGPSPTACGEPYTAALPAAVLPPNRRYIYKTKTMPGYVALRPKKCKNFFTEKYRSAANPPDQRTGCCQPHRPAYPRNPSARTDRLSGQTDQPT